MCCAIRNRHLVVYAACLAAALSVASLAEPPAREAKNVAIVLYDGVELLDFAGPGEVFAAARLDRTKLYRVYTVAEHKTPIVSQGFVTITPEYSIADAPKPDIIVIPGGMERSLTESEPAMAWIKKVSRRAKVTSSVCTGAFALAKLGMLDGRDATTHWGAIDKLREIAPTTRVLENRRFVDSGKYITAAGVSAGIDMALYIVAQLNGVAAAEQAARYMEYEWVQAAALRGFDPVLLAAGKEVVGDAARSFAHGGFRYAFATDQNLTKFKSDPERFGIQAKGGCGSMPEYTAAPGIVHVHEGRIYIFAHDTCRDDFIDDTATALANIEAVSKRGELCKNCPPERR